MNNRAIVSYKTEDGDVLYTVADVERGEFIVYDCGGQVFWASSLEYMRGYVAGLSDYEESNRQQHWLRNRARTEELTESSD